MMGREIDSKPLETSIEGRCPLTLEEGDHGAEISREDLIAEVMALAAEVKIQRLRLTALQRQIAWTYGMEGID